MNLFTVKYRYWSKLLDRKGLWLTQEVTFKALNQMEALREAKRYGKQIWNRRRWEIVACQIRATG